MALPEKPAPAPSAVAPPSDRCRYCGAPLNPFFYFCLQCATPYKDVEGVLSPSRPIQPTDGMLIAAKAPHVAPLFWTYVAVVVGTAVLAFLLFDERRPDLALLFQTVTLFATTCIFAAIHWPSLWVQFKRLGLLHWACWAAVAALVPLLLLNYAYHGWIVHRLGSEHFIGYKKLHEAGLSSSSVVILFCLFPAVTEETAFRGLIQHWLQTAIPARRAIVLAAALFTALHFSILSAPYLFLVGLLLGWAKWKTGSLYPSMLVHFLHNYVALEWFRF